MPLAYGCLGFYLLVHSYSGCAIFHRFDLCVGTHAMLPHCVHMWIPKHPPVWPASTGVDGFEFPWRLNRWGCMSWSQCTKYLLNETVWMEFGVALASRADASQVCCPYCPWLVASHQWNSILGVSGSHSSTSRPARVSDVALCHPGRWLIPAALGPFFLCTHCPECQCHRTSFCTCDVRLSCACLCDVSLYLTWDLDSYTDKTMDSVTCQTRK